MTFERHIRELVAHLFHADWEQGWGDFLEAEKDLNKELEAAITDRWVEWKERTNGLRSNRAALAGDGAGDSDRAQPGAVAQQDVGERRVEFDFAAVAEMQQEMERVREGQP